MGRDGSDPAAQRRQGAGGDVGEAFGFSKSSAECDVRVSPDTSGRALQARPLAGVSAQGTEALEAALPGSSWVLPRVTSANTAAMAPLGAAWPGAAVGTSGDSLTGDQFAGAELPYSYRQREKSLLSEQSVQINCYQPRATQAFHCCQTATLRALLQLPGSSSSNQLWVCESAVCASLVGAAAGAPSVVTCTGLLRHCRKRWLLSTGGKYKYKHEKGLVYRILSLHFL